MSGKKITGRTKQLSLKSTPEFHQRLKELATKEKCLMIEILEKALAVYEIQQQKDLVKKIAKDTTPKSRDTILPSAVKKRQVMDGKIEEPSTSSKKRKVSEK